MQLGRPVAPETGGIVAHGWLVADEGPEVSIRDSTSALAMMPFPTQVGQSV